jgi:hypothetical protein
VLIGLIGLDRGSGVVMELYDTLPVFYIVVDGQGRLVVLDELLVEV